MANCSSNMAGVWADTVVTFTFRIVYSIAIVEQALCTTQAQQTVTRTPSPSATGNWPAVLPTSGPLPFPAPWPQPRQALAAP